MLNVNINEELIPNNHAKTIEIDTKVTQINLKIDFLDLENGILLALMFNIFLHEVQLMNPLRNICFPTQYLWE